MKKRRNMQLLGLHYGIILFSLLTQTLHAKTHLSNSSTTAPRDVDQELKKKLRIGVPTTDGAHELLHTNISEMTVTGYCIDVFFAATQGLNYDYEFIPYFIKNGNYNDLVYQLHLQKLDAVVGDVTIRAERLEYADFTLPFTDIGVGTMVKRVDQKDMWIFLRPLDMNLWLTSLAFFIFTGFIVWVIEHSSNSDFQGSLSQQVGTVFWFIFSTLFFSQKEKLTSNLSKFIVVVWMFAVLILTSSYTATLASLLTVQQIQPTTLISGGGSIGYQYGSFMQNVMLDELHFRPGHIRPYRSVMDYAEALSKGGKDGGADAIVDEIPYLKLFLAKHPDGYTLVESTPTTNGFGFAFRKGSPLVSYVSREIAKLRESGDLLMIEDKWFKSTSTFGNEPDPVDNIPKTLDFYRFRGLFLITGFSSTSALVIFLLYRLYRCIVKLVNVYIFTFLDGEILPV